MPASNPDNHPEIRVVIGLGNPGRDYEGTRHNVGFEIVDRLARAAGASWQKEKKWRAEIARCGSTILVKPQTYMNLSGSAAAAVGGFYKLPAAAMLVVYDDVDLPLGQLRFRAEGSAGGHNGIKSMIQSFGSDRFARLKFGIGRQPPAADSSAASRAPQRSMVGHVLGRFASDEREELEKSLANAEDAVNCALSRGLASAMNEFNRKPSKPKRPARSRNIQPSEKPKKPDSAAPETAAESDPEPES